MRSYVPKVSGKVPFAFQVRAAAVWSLGKLLTDKLDPVLASQLEVRLADVGSVPPEADQVRAMAAITMGRMKSQPSLPALRKWYETNTYNNYVGRACGWGIEQLTGEKMPDPDVMRPRAQNWFLEPVEPKQPE